MNPFDTATVLTTALRERRIGSRELLQHYLDRVAGLNPRLTAVVTLDAERALAEARAADEAAARGESRGPLAGLPVTVKDTIETAGLRTTAGAPQLSDHVPAADAPAVARLRAAGAIVFGKTNTATWAADAQTSNELFGTTNNPWDVTRSPGGSSGGPAAAVSAGLTGLDLGSDLGGSIRMPAGYCGVFGLRPSFGVVPGRGHLPPPPGARTEVDMGVLGPLARGAADLGLALDVLAGPDHPQSRAWRLELPPPRASSLSGYRMAAWIDDPYLTVDAAVRTVLDTAIDALREAGAKVDVVTGPVDGAESARLFQRLIQPMVAMTLPDEEFDALLAGPPPTAGPAHLAWVGNVTMRARDWALAHERRLALVAAWADFFDRYDALLCPVTPTAAIPHDHTPDPDARTITVNGRRAAYWSQVRWTQAFSPVHLPVAVVPAGSGPDGLPVGMQVVGAHLDDRTVVDVAGRLADVLGGYRPPPGW